MPRTHFASHTRRWTWNIKTKIMNNTYSQENLKKAVLEKIQAGEIAMKPKAYFVLSVTALICLSILILVTSVFLISYTLFTLSVSGRLLLLGFGLRGFFAFVLLFPWFIFLLDIAFIWVLDLLIQRFRFAYHRPLIYVFVGTTLVVVLASLAFNATHFHGELQNRAERKQLPMFGGMYNHLRDPYEERGVFQGVVKNIEGNTFTIDPDEDDSDTRVILVITPDDTVVHDLITVGDHVFVAGDIIDGEIHAYGIKKFFRQ